jgi:hypothetical protein
VTRYYIDISPELVNSSEFPDGFRLIQRWGPRDSHRERWIVEDEGADASYEDHLVELTFSRTGSRSEIKARYLRN